MSTNSHFDNFLSRHVVSGDWIPFSVLHAAFLEYCKFNGITLVEIPKGCNLSLEQFEMMLKDRGFRVVKPIDFPHIIPNIRLQTYPVEEKDKSPFQKFLKSDQ